MRRRYATGDSPARRDRNQTHRHDRRSYRDHLRDYREHHGWDEPGEEQDLGGQKEPHADFRGLELGLSVGPVVAVVVPLPERFQRQELAGRDIKRSV